MAVAQEELACKVSGWVANLLAAERASINQLLMQHHDALLFKLGADLRGKDGQFLAQGASMDADVLSESLAVQGNNAKNDPPTGGEVQPIEGETKGQVELSDAMGTGTRTSEISDISQHDKDIQREDTVDLISPSNSKVIESEPTNIMGRIAAHALFEAFFVTIILINTVFSAFQGQYRGLEIGYQIGYEGYTWHANSIWPGAADVFKYAEITFAVLYTTELSIKLVGLQLKFFKDRWNLFDFFLVVFWYLKHFGIIGDTINPMILRLCRLARLMRLVRHVGWFESFDSLFIIIKAIRSSFSVLVWAMMILGTLLLICSLCMSSFMADYLENPLMKTNKIEVYKYFGTFTRSLVTIFEISFASHVPVCRAIMENVHEGYALFFMGYKLVVGLSVLKVITGVFLHETFKVCTEDDELMIIQKKRNQRKYTIKMNKLFERLDESGDGSLTWEEFEKVIDDQEVRTWLSAMDVDTRHPHRLWRLLDGNDDCLTAPELVKGISHLKGPSKSTDVNHLIRELEDINKAVRDMHCKMHNRVSECGTASQSTKLPPLDPAYLQACMDAVPKQRVLAAAGTDNDKFVCL